MKYIIILVILLVSACDKMEKYEQENNCKYDTNGLCYNETERPWLFR